MNSRTSKLLNAYAKLRSRSPKSLKAAWCAMSKSDRCKSRAGMIRALADDGNPKYVGLLRKAQGGAA